MGNVSLDWLIGGGESGANPRQMQSEWAADIRDQCEKHDVGFFFKQWGGRKKQAAGRELEGAFTIRFRSRRRGGGLRRGEALPAS